MRVQLLFEKSFAAKAAAIRNARAIKTERDSLQP